MKPDYEKISHTRNFFYFLLAFLMISCSGDSYKGIEEDEAKIPEEAMNSLQTEEDLDVLLEDIGDAKIVLLGEASHGTSEFYTWRAAISQRLISEKGFDMIAVEGDWADAYPLNSYIKGNSTYTNAEDVLQNFNRWPEWMWANEEVAELTEWLREYNSGVSANEKASFYGLDVYGLWESMRAVHLFLQQMDPEAAENSRAVLDCFAPYDQDENAYARATLSDNGNCAEEVASMLKSVENIIANRPEGDEAAFNALQNARVVANAESYYRAAARNNAISWNIRDMHMHGTISRLLDHHGADSKIIVWEHNSHVGDARATDMADAGIVNVGQLVRENYGRENVYITGFGTYSGKVIAAESWGARRRTMNVPKAQRNSWEWLLHQQGPTDMIILTKDLQQQNFYKQRIGHRAIGVVYNPGQETGNYVPSVIPERYDAFIFIDETQALNALD